MNKVFRIGAIGGLVVLAFLCCSPVSARDNEWKGKVEDALMRMEDKIEAMRKLLGEEAESTGTRRKGDSLIMEATEKEIRGEARWDALIVGPGEFQLSIRVLQFDKLKVHLSFDLKQGELVGHISGRGPDCWEAGEITFDVEVSGWVKSSEGAAWWQTGFAEPWWYFGGTTEVALTVSGKSQYGARTERAQKKAEIKGAIESDGTDGWFTIKWDAEPRRIKPMALVLRYFWLGWNADLAVGSEPKPHFAPPKRYKR